MYIISIFSYRANNNDRSHQDRTYQYCSMCDAMRPFLWDRCEVCKSN